MKTLLELIESWEPCEAYAVYLEVGTLTPQTTIKDILYSKVISDLDKGWFFDKLFAAPLYAQVCGNVVAITQFKRWFRPTIYRYDYETFLAMVYEYLEHADIDAAI